MVQWCKCYNWVHLKCSLLSFSKFRTFGSSHSWSCPTCFFWRFHTYQQCDFLLGLLQLVYLPLLKSGPSDPSANAALAPHSRLQTSYPFPPTCIFCLCTLTTASRSWLFLFTSCFLFPSLISSGCFNGMLGISKPGELNCYTLFCLIPLTSFAFRNPILIYLPLSGSLDSLLCDPVAPNPGLVFFLLISQTLAAASSFSSGRAYSFLSFLPPLFLRLTDPYCDYIEINISLNDSSSLSFLNVYVPFERYALLRRIAEPISFLCPFFPPM